MPFFGLGKNRFLYECPWAVLGPGEHSPIESRGEDQPGGEQGAGQECGEAPVQRRPGVDGGQYLHEADPHQLPAAAGHHGLVPQLYLLLQHQTPCPHAGILQENE